MDTVVLINPFEVPADQEDAEFLAGWQAAADYLQGRPGFVDARLHRALAPDARFRYVNVARWRSPADFRAAVTSEGFRALAGGTVPNFPALYEVARTVEGAEAAAGVAGGGAS
jgi:heme-degrading monooxygenase HmoA